MSLFYNNRARKYTGSSYTGRGLSETPFHLKEVEQGALRRRLEGGHRSVERRAGTPADRKACPCFMLKTLPADLGQLDDLDGDVPQEGSIDPHLPELVFEDDDGPLDVARKLTDGRGLPRAKEAGYDEDLHSFSSLPFTKNLSPQRAAPPSPNDASVPTIRKGPCGTKHNAPATRAAARSGTLRRTPHHPCRAAAKGQKGRRPPR